HGAFVAPEELDFLPVDLRPIRMLGEQLVEAARSVPAGQNKRKPPGRFDRHDGDAAYLLGGRLEQIVRVVELSNHFLAPGSTCPPKPFRMADSIFSAKVWSWRDRKRA